jgi:ParB-like chromosome segregation protein Spo0J
MAYWRSGKGLRATRLRVSAWRAAHKEEANVTHASAQEVGPSTIVASRDTASSAVEAGAAAVMREETSHEADRGGDLAHVEPAQSAGVVAGPQEAERVAAILEPVRDVTPRADGERGVAEAGDPRCARCRRRGVEATGEIFDARFARPASRTRGASCPMTSAAEAARSCPIATIGTALGGARCRLPARIERMKQSLATHGQLTALVATARPEGVELIDGFKRLAAAETLGWPTLLVAVRPLDAAGQWATMLLLNRGPTSMTTLEEALVLRELCKTGLTQTEVAALCARHKAWVNRRIGLVDRLHPELVEAMKLGLLHPGSARRLLSLPPGNQVEMATAIQSAGLGPRDTELLVGLWRRTKDPGARRVLLREPRASLREHHPETRRSPLDPRLSPEGQRLCRCLHRFETAAAETSRRLLSASSTADRTVLEGELRKASEAASRLATELGSARTVVAAGASGGSGATS